MKSLLSAALLLVPFVWLFGQQRTPLAAPSRSTADADNNIQLLSLNQPPCTVLNRESVLKAKVAYHLAAAEQSEYGYNVSIKFQTTNPGVTYSAGTMGNVRVTSKNDTLTITYPIAAVSSNPRLLRPITCYFYLHRNTGPGHSTVIAKTPPIVFQECL